MNTALAWIDRIQNAAAGHVALLVEGDEDVRLFGHFFELHDDNWRSILHIASADGKRHVRQGVTVHRTDWIGIIDADESSPEKIEEQSRASARLLMLPRFCIESYFCDPDELWNALPNEITNDRNKETLAEPILNALPAWVQHGAMWRVWHRTLPDQYFPSELINAPITDETKIPLLLADWHNNINPAILLEMYHKEREIGKALTQKEHLTNYVHGKKFFHMVVVPELNRLFVQKSVEGWLEEFRNLKIKPPPDLQTLLDSVLNLANQR